MTVGAVRCFREPKGLHGLFILGDFHRRRVDGQGARRDKQGAMDRSRRLTRAVEAELCRNVTIYGSCKYEGKGRDIAAILHL
jgi:hypothetical protein